MATVIVVTWIQIQYECSAGTSGPAAVYRTVAHRPSASTIGAMRTSPITVSAIAARTQGPAGAPPARHRLAATTPAPAPAPPSAPAAFAGITVSAASAVSPGLVTCAGVSAVACAATAAPT